METHFIILEKEERTRWERLSSNQGAAQAAVFWN